MIVRLSVIVERMHEYLLTRMKIAGRSVCGSVNPLRCYMKSVMPISSFSDMYYLPQHTFRRKSVTDDIDFSQTFERDVKKAGGGTLL